MTVEVCCTLLQTHVPSWAMCERFVDETIECLVDNQVPFLKACMQMTPRLLEGILRICGGPGCWNSQAAARHSVHRGCWGAVEPWVRWLPELKPTKGPRPRDHGGWGLPR